MKTLFNIMNLFFKFNRFNSKKKENTITFYFFDETTYTNYTTYVDNKFIYNKPSHIDRGLIFDDSNSIKSSTGVLSNTYLNKALTFTIDADGLGITIKFNNKYRHTNFDDDFEFFRYMSIIPKYHCLSSANHISKEIQNIIIGFLEQLNDITKDFPTDYDIIAENNKDYDKLLKQMSNYSNNHENNKLLCVLINNNYNKKSNIHDYYYYFKHDGPTMGIAYLNAYNYVHQLKTYQPLEIGSDTKYNIEFDYKGQPPLFSKVVNEGIQNRIINDIKLSEGTANRIKTVMSYLNCKAKSNYDKEVFYVFHGTQYMMHAKGQNEINLLSFLSCSFNIYISIDYALNNLSSLSSKKNKGIVYVFKVNKSIKYINFGDGLFQILLLPGTKILIKNEFNVGHIKYVLCDIDNNNNIEFGKRILAEIENNTILPNVYNIQAYNILKPKTIYPNCQYVELSGTRIQYRPNVEHIYHINHNSHSYIYTSLYKVMNLSTMDNRAIKINSFANIEYLLHQHIINDCYIYFKCNCVKYKIFYNNSNHPNNIYSAWNIDDNYQTLNNNFVYDINNFWIDTLLGNTECMTGRHYLKHKDNGEQRLVWFKGCGLYNTSGYRKPRFNSKDAPYEYLGILDYLMSDLQSNSDKILGINNQTFIANLKGFNKALNNIEKGYLDFLDYHTDIPKDSMEYKDIKKMIVDLISALQYRSEYFLKHMDTIEANIIEFIGEETDISPASFGGDSSMRFDKNLKPSKNILSIYQHLKQDKKHNHNLNKLNKLDQVNTYIQKMSSTSDSLSVSSNSNSKKQYELIKNIPLPESTEVRAKYLREPYRTYYKGAERNQIIDYSNQGFAVSNKDFDMIKKRLGM